MENRWLRPGEFREVVQIGAVRVDVSTWQIVAEFETLVRPRINGTLSSYFETLTGITNAKLAQRGVDLCDAYRHFVAFAQNDPIASFGRDDLVLTRNLALYGIWDAQPLPVHHNIAPWLNESGVATKGLHACDIARACGAEFAGREHDALDDARSLAIGARRLIAQGARNPFAD